MTQTCKISFLILAFAAGLALPVGAQAASFRQEDELSPEQAAAQDRAGSEMATVIFDVCVPVVGGTDVTDTPGYDALGRPPIVDGSFETSTGITVTPELADGAGCSFYPKESWQPRMFSFLLPLENQDQSREAGEWNPVPLRVDEDYHKFISRDARIGIGISRNYSSGSVFAYKSPPQEVASHYAAVWEAAFNPPGEAALLAFDACSSFMDMVTQTDTSDTPLIEVAADARFGNTGAPVRGNIDASLYPDRDGCVLFVQDRSLAPVIAQALGKPGSGWSSVTETSWARADGGRVELKNDGEVLDYYVHPGDFARHTWTSGDWDWRGEEEPTDEAAPAS